MATVQIESVRFAVLDQPMCVWSPHLAQTNLRFLRSFDPKFFLYQAGVHITVANDSTAPMPASMHGALALRIAYGMALESLFAVVGAVVQAPDCVFGWLTSYTNADLTGLVRRISAGEALKTLRPFRPPTWEKIASVLLAPVAARSADEHERTAARFAAAWRRFAHEFTSDDHCREYNSLKHSFRVAPAGLSFRFEHQGTALLESQSPFGHSFPRLRRIEGRKTHFEIGQTTMALEPDKYRAGLGIAAASIHNAIAFALFRAGEPAEELRAQLPDEALFDALERPGAPVAALSTGERISMDEYWSDADILSVYDDPPEAADA